MAVLSLALGTGANTTIFTLLNAILFRPLPVAQPERVVAIHTVDSKNAGFLLCSYPNYVDYRDRNQVFSSVVLYAPVLVNLTGHGEPRSIMGHLVSANYFGTLGVKPALGRGFVPEDDTSAEAVAIISYSQWKQTFAGDPQVTSKTLLLNGRAFEIVGVAPPDFPGISSLYAADVWVPFAMYPQVYPNPAWVMQRRALLFSAAARLKPGIGMAQAETAMQTIAQDLEHTYPKDNTGRRVKLTSINDAAIAPKTRDVLSRAGIVLLIISGLVLLIACGNVANLLLARAAGRSREITVRIALGSSRWLLIRQLLVESLVLSAAGGVLGLLFARWARDVLWSMRPPILTTAGFRLDLDPVVLSYALGTSILTGLLFGLAPALRSTRVDLAVDLKERSGQPASAGGQWGARSLLVIFQVALSLIALIGAGLFLRSLRNAIRFDPGFDAIHVAAISFNLSGQGYTEARGREFHRVAMQRIAGLPGVDSVALSKDSPLSVNGARTVLIPGREETSGGGSFTLTTVVSPGYFRSLRIPVLQGRDFLPPDTKTSPRVAILNEAAAAHIWPGENAVGKVLQFYGENLPVEIVGIVRNSNYQAIHEAPQPLIFLSFGQYYVPYGSIYLHTAGDPDAAVASARREVRSLDPNLVLESETVTGAIRQSLWPQRLSAGLLALFGFLGLLLAAIGIYGVISYAVHQRSREIGVRMALGATAGSVQLMVLREGVRLVAVGVLCGMLVSLIASQAVQTLLFATGPRDAATFVLVPCMLAFVAIVACWLPARRATRVDPAIALRDE